MADSENTTTLPVSRRHLLAGAGVAVLSVAATSGAATGDDAELLNLIQRLQAKAEEDRQLNDELDALSDQVPSLEWTVEELAAHRIQDRKDRPRHVTLEEIERNDTWDRPDQRDVQRTVVEREDGYTMSVTIVRPEVTAADWEAWRVRCRERRALYDAKHTAMKDAEERLGIAAGNSRSAAINGEWFAIRDRILATPAVTVRGAVSKLKAAVDVDAADPYVAETLLFLSALADLERLAGGAA